jgi:hypothetical protein
MDLDRLLYLVSGWVLGMASSLLLDAVRRQRRLREIRAGLATEVCSLRYLLAHLAYEFARRTGKWNRELLSSLLPALDLETEVALPTRMGEAVRGLLTGSDEHLAEAAKRIAPSPEASVSPRTYHLPYLEANIDAVARLGEEPRRKLLGIKAQLDGLNQAMADIRELNASTFQDLTPENRQRIEQNLQASYGNVLERCLIIEELAADLKLS